MEMLKPKELEIANTFYCKFLKLIKPLNAIQGLEWELNPVQYILALWSSPQTARLFGRLVQ